MIFSQVAGTAAREELYRMNREQAKEYVKQGLEQYLQGKGINTRKPFRCLNPAHNDKHASMSVDRSSRSGLHCKCFSCNAYYDTFDLISIDTGITEELELFNKAYEIFGLDVETSYRQSAAEDFREGREYQKEAKIERNTQATLHNTQYAGEQQIIEDLEQAPIIDFSREIEAAHKALLENEAALSYFQSRGLSMDIIKRYKLGYAAGGYNSLLQAHVENQSRSKKAALYNYVFPYTDLAGKHTYFLTEISDRQQVDDYNGKYRKISKGNTGIAAQIFNERYLQQEQAPEVIFICEGIYDALSVEEAGGAAIAFVGTAHRRFLSLCKKYKPDTTFVISLDNDQAGQQAIDRVKEGLELLELPYIVRTAASGKDFNDALKEDRGAFTDYIQQAIYDAGEDKRKLIEAEREAYLQTSTAYLQTSTAYHLQSFVDDIEKSKQATFLPTGFVSVDNLLDGGLYAGLYCIGAISSLGKTTFCLQIIDNIAAAGHDCMIFSLEMARGELIAKSVSRLTLIEDLKQNNSTAHAKTTRGITTGTRYSGYSQQDREIIGAAITAYSHYADHIFIHEGVGNIGVEQIREKVEQHIRITGNKPVILIDYLQILAPYNDRATDKQNTDKAVLELKRISRDFSIPVIGISSFNRDNYTAPVNMASFKESGAVEYSSDVLLALQYEGMDWQEGENQKDRDKRVRQLMNDVISTGRQGKAQSIQVKILKNRNGSKGDTCIDFYPMFNYFTEKGKAGAALKGQAPAAADEWTTIAGDDPEIPFD